ncbi:hydantoinase/oxoprolinase family protein, partial [Rhizobiaceae sp. 2RAB30]
MTEPSRPLLRIGIDVGGTFTDFVAADRNGGRIVRHKESSTPADPSLSVALGLPALLEKAAASPADVELILHGTTLLVNGIIERRGARVGLLVSQGLRGILEIGRARLPSSHDFRVAKEEPLVTRDLVLETCARMRADGSIVARAEPAEIERLAEQFRAAGVEAVTVLLLHSYSHPELEEETARALENVLPDIPVIRSAAIWPERREYERSLVAVMNAYVQPMMNSYLDRLTERMVALGFKAPIYITTSNGGTQSVTTARQRPIEAALSGPASGVVAAIRAAVTTGHDRIVTVDIGGTSADISVIRGLEPTYTTRTHVGGLPLVTPAVDVSAIGAGGGSIVWLDPQGILKVGPRSAGAVPGPICYGRGGKEVTITDCFTVLGYLDPATFLNGRMRLD